RTGSSLITRLAGWASGRRKLCSSGINYTSTFTVPSIAGCTWPGSKQNVRIGCRRKCSNTPVSRLTPLLLSPSLLICSRAKENEDEVCESSPVVVRGRVEEPPLRSEAPCHGHARSRGLRKWTYSGGPELRYFRDQPHRYQTATVGSVPLDDRTPYSSKGREQRQHRCRIRRDRRNPIGTPVLLSGVIRTRGCPCYQRRVQRLARCRSADHS